MNKLIKSVIIFAILLGIHFPSDAEDKIRVVSLSPNITELIFHLGKGDCLIGRSSACDYPDEAKKLPIAGKFGVPSMEFVAGLKPDYIVSSGIRDDGIRKNIEELGIKFILLPNETIDDYYMAVSELGRILNCKARADIEIRRVKTIFDAEKKITGTIPPEKKTRVYLEVWDNPLMTVGGKSFVNDLIAMSGGVNVAGKENIGYLKCSREWVILSKPDVIIAPAMGKFAGSEIKKRQGWSEIPAVKNNRIYTGMDESLIYRLGPRMTESLKIFRRCFFPDGIPMLEEQENSNLKNPSSKQHSK